MTERFVTVRRLTVARFRHIVFSMAHLAQRTTTTTTRDGGLGVVRAH